MNLGTLPEILLAEGEAIMADRIRSNVKSLLKKERSTGKTETRPKSQKAPKKPSPAASKPTRATQMNGPPTISNLPRMKPRITMRPGPMHNSVRVSMADYLGPLRAASADLEPPQRGAQIFTTNYSPARVEGSKISTIATMYERYVVNNLRFHYFSATPTSVGGALVMGFDKDPTDPSYAGEAGVRRALGLSSMTQFAPWEHASLTVEKENQQTTYYTSAASTGDEPERLEYTGTLFVTVTTPGSLTPNLPLGDIWFEADVTFYDPTWEPTDVTATVSTIDPLARSLSLADDAGFLGQTDETQLVESNIRFCLTGSEVGLPVAAAGFIIPASGATYHMTDTIIGLDSTVRVTAQSLNCYPLGGGRIDVNYANEVINYAPNFQTSATSATQTNWATDFTFQLPFQVFTGTGAQYHSVMFWYVTSTFTGTVAGNYTQRTVLINREAGFFGDFGVSRRHRKTVLRTKKSESTGEPRLVRLAPNSDGSTRIIPVEPDADGKSKNSAKAGTGLQSAPSGLIRSSGRGRGMSD